MADAAEAFSGPPAIDTTGNLTVWAVKTIGDIAKPKKSELDEATCYRITYSFKPSGYSFSISTPKQTDDRLTAKIGKQSFGIAAPEFADFVYVDSAQAKSAAVVLTAGDWFIVERRNKAQSIVATVGDDVTVFKVTLSDQVKGPIEAGEKFTITQAVAVQEITDGTVKLITG